MAEPDRYLFVPDDTPPRDALAGRRSVAFWSDVWRRFRQSGPAMTGMAILLLFIALAILAPMLSRYNYDQVDLLSTYQPPNATHWFGTDALGRDIWVAIWVGARVSLTVGLAAALCQMLIGVVIGCFSGLQGGKTDMLLMRFVDIMIAIPFLIWVSLFMLIMSPGITSIVLAFALTQWTEIARLVRGEVLKLKETEFIVASRSMGASALRLIGRHFFPNILPVVIVAVTFQVTNAIFGEAFLSYIGLGIQPPLTSWGKLIAGGIKEMRDNPYLLIFPSIVISATMLSLQLVGDGLRDATDPKLRR
ncbi:ABC transporter permease [Nordella sp. HKS 07]|uniref:ABC transporter permease n=1 Tax=Nordella sp. HKS 07 TaxID=2712222 RepID=UPI0013E1B0F2|nr:ABC transporter permease [Nordella sp. HKS 07]QIG48773.1 ABC transporter permease [Nordella sp. HKS 07]